MTDTDRMVVWLREAMDAVQRDAEAATVATGGPHWHGSDSGLYSNDASSHPGPFLADAYGYTAPEVVAHIVRHSPATVLRRIAADRDVVEWCTEVVGDTDLSNYEQFGSLRDHPQALAVTLAVETIRNLAKGWGWKGGDQ